MACLAGAASKEVMVSAPLVVLLFDYTFVSDSLRQAWRRSWPLYVGLAASWLVLVALQWNTPRSESAGFGLSIPLLDWWSTQAKVFQMYLRLALYPWPLLIHYESSYQPLAVNWFYVLVVAVLAAGTAVLVWRRRPAGFLLSCVFLILAPTHLVPIPTEMAAERRMYLPLAALVALVVVGVFALIGRIAANSARDGDIQATRRRLVAFCGAAVLLLAVVYGVASAQRAELFREPIALWEDVVAQQPRSYVAHQALATALGSADRLNEAIDHYRLAIRYKPDYAEAHYGLSLTLAQVGRFDDSIAEMQAAVNLKPKAVRLRNNLGVMLYTAGRLPEAIAEFEKTLELRARFHRGPRQPEPRPASERLAQQSRNKSP